MKNCAGDWNHESPAHLSASAGMEQIQAGGETRVRGRLQVWIWLQVLCNGGMALGLSLLYLLDLGSADLPLVFRWGVRYSTFCSAAVSLSAGTTTAAVCWAWRCWERSPAAMATPGPVSSAHCSPRLTPSSSPSPTPCSILAPGKTKYSLRKAIINFLLTYISKDHFQFLQEGGAVLSSGCL